jgi:nucleotide-binding universal stress UspA family protein
MFEEVVVGVRDDDAGPDAIALAMEMASADRELTLVHVHVVANKPAPDSGSVGDAAKCRYALERLTALRAEFLVDAEVSCIEARSVRRGLHEFASARHADLLVVGASHNDELARDLAGDDTREVLQEAPCAVAVAPAGYAARAAAMRRIGVAYDGSAESERALALGRRLAAERHAELSVFEAVSAPMYVRDPWDVRGVEIDEQVEQARQKIAALGGLEAGAEFGAAVEELVQYGHAVDLLVLGSHRYRPIDRLLKRSTSQQLADGASSPLVVLPSSTRAGG